MGYRVTHKMEGENQTLKLKSVTDTEQCGRRINYKADKSVDTQEIWFLEHFCELHSPVHTRHSPLLDIFVSYPRLNVKKKTRGRNLT